MDLSALDLSGMSQWDQVLTYALGAWIAQVDGVVSTSEFDMLGELGTKMGLAEALRKRATAVANDIACLPEGGKPEKYDFEKLIARLKERMPQLAESESLRPTVRPRQELRSRFSVAHRNHEVRPRRRSFVRFFFRPRAHVDVRRCAVRDGFSIGRVRVTHHDERCGQKPRELTCAIAMISGGIELRLLRQIPMTEHPTARDARARDEKMSGAKAENSAHDEEQRAEKRERETIEENARQNSADRSRDRRRLKRGERAEAFHSDARGFGEERDATIVLFAERARRSLKYARRRRKSSTTASTNRVAELEHVAHAELRAERDVFREAHRLVTALAACPTVGRTT